MMELVSKVTSGVFVLVAANLALIIGVTFYIIPVGGTVTVSPNKANQPYILYGQVETVHDRVLADVQITIANSSNMMQSEVQMSMSDESSPRTVRTENNGKFRIGNISSGTYIVSVKADGFKPWKQQMTITKNKSITVTLHSSR